MLRRPIEKAKAAFLVLVIFARRLDCICGQKPRAIVVISAPSVNLIYRLMTDHVRVLDERTSFSPKESFRLSQRLFQKVQVPANVQAIHQSMMYFN